jgi:hypothetical protein
LFNERKQVNKQISAVSVILLQLYFSLIEIINLGENQCYSYLVLAYSLICLFSFFNAYYVRDFEALQVNITPIILSIAGSIAIQSNFSIPILGMNLALIADSYYALRFKDEEDFIQYTPIEKFSLESWTQEVFRIGKNST